MKTAKALLIALLLVSIAGTALAASDGVISRQPFTPDSYCHEVFPAITPSSLASDAPVLKSSMSGDVIDFYGSCAESSTGKDQVNQQKLERAHRWENSYGG